MSNMYEKITSKGETVNPVSGECMHNCEYCYTKSLKKRSPHIRKKYTGRPWIDHNGLKRIYGSGKFFFVCSCCDLFAENVPDMVVERVLRRCREFPRNRYLFQSKNPGRFIDFIDQYPSDSVLCTTLETNRDTSEISYAPIPRNRAVEMVGLRHIAVGDKRFELWVTIEPILDFDLEEFVNMIKRIQPDLVHVGADSKRCGLDEPSGEKVEELLKRLRAFTVVVEKSNLSRLIGKRGEQ